MALSTTENDSTFGCGLSGDSSAEKIVEDGIFGNDGASF